MKSTDPVSVCTTLFNPSKNGNCADADSADAGTLTLIESTAESAGITLDVDGDQIVIEGPTDSVAELAAMIRHWKPELIKILQGQTVGDVGICDCGSELIGLPTIDGFINRVCRDCGQWFRCVPGPFLDEVDR